MAKFNLKTATMDEIEQECMSLQGTPYGHNMIGIICNVVEERFGEKESTRIYETYQV